MGTVSIEADSAKEYREKVKHARAIGLEVSEVRFRGAWEDPEGAPVFMDGTTNDVKNVGHTYFHVPLSTPEGTEVVKIQPAHSTTKERGSVRVALTD